MASLPQRDKDEEGEVGEIEEVQEDERLPSKRCVCEYEEIPSGRWFEALRFSRASSVSSRNGNLASDSGRALSRENSSLSNPTWDGDDHGHAGNTSSSPTRNAKKTSRRSMFNLWGKKKRSPAMETIVDDDFVDLPMVNLKRYSENEVRWQTDCLHRDAFYDVYMGITIRGEDVIVKRYNESSGLGYFEREIRAISMCRHRNVAAGLGWCRRDGYMHVIYEFLPDTLKSCLESDSVFLTLDARYSISLDLASAILYIHEQCNHCILHGDIKSGNVLLDSNLNAKLASFELARFRSHGEEDGDMAVMGTAPYIDPEYVLTRVYTKASDVYSFGIVLLEIATGVHPFRNRDELTLEEPSSPYSEEVRRKESLFEWVWEKHMSNKLVDVVDKRLNFGFDKFVIECLLQTGLLCAQPNSKLRPSIKQAINYLKSGVPISAMPKRNFDSNDGENIDEFSFSQEFLSTAGDVLQERLHESQFTGNLIKSSSTAYMELYIHNKLSVKKFSYQELRKATNNFSYDNILWIGGNGVIYQGYIDDVNMHVAIKRIYVSPINKRTELFTEETQTLSFLKHKNIVQLKGWCYDNGECLIIYELMARDNLFYYLHSASKFLPWETRYKIALDLTFAILYIHEEHDGCILHTNITSTNILLDENTSKLTGFEAATLPGHGIDRAMLRTPCYMDPESLQKGNFSKFSDVYSFGIIILEIACGKMVVDVDEDGKRIHLFDKVWDLYFKGAIIEAADERLNKRFDVQEMERLLLVGLVCAQQNSQYRPSIKEVAQVFEFQKPLSDLILDNAFLSSSSSFSSSEIASKKPSIIYDDALESSIMDENVPESTDLMTAASTPLSDELAIDAETVPAQENFYIGIPPDYSHSGASKEFHLQVMKGYMLGLHENIKLGARFDEVMETLKTLTAALMIFRAPLDEWNCFAQYVLRSLKEIETLKAKHNKEELCLATTKLSLVKEEMEQYVEHDQNDGVQLAKSISMMASIQEEHDLLWNAKCDLEKQLVEVQEKIKDAETRRCSFEDEIKAIEKRRVQYKEILELKREECSILMLYDRMLSRVATFSSV